jgi:hypothetical protein
VESERTAPHPPLLPGFRLDPRERQHVGAAAARRLRVPRRERSDPEGNGDVRALDSRVVEREVSRSPLGRKLRGGPLRAAGLEDGVPESRIPSHGCCGCFLGRQVDGSRISSNTMSGVRDRYTSRI